MTAPLHPPVADAGMPTAVCEQCPAPVVGVVATEQEKPALQRALYRLMSDISEECWCAGWMHGNEFSLWRIVSGAAESRRYGQSEVSEQEVADLKSLSEAIGGWIRWADDESDMDLPNEMWGERFIAMPDWLTMYERRMAAWENAKYRTALAQIVTEDPEGYFAAIAAKALA